MTSPHFDEGLQLRERRRLKAAVAAFEQAVADDPTCSLAWFWLAATRDNRGEEREAIPAYERALDLGLPPTETVKAWTWLASSYSKLGGLSDALRALSEASRLGGYEPVDEFRSIASRVERRIERAKRRDAR